MNDSTLGEVKNDENLPICDCNRDEKAKYVCLKEEC